MNLSSQNANNSLKIRYKYGGVIMNQPFNKMKGVKSVWCNRRGDTLPNTEQGSAQTQKGNPKVEDSS
jgi:hypothetical protein